jgi:DHA2 family integral membrane protein (MFS transporter)
VALSVAVLGSILAQSYHSSLSPTLAKLPSSLRDAAGQSISATQAVAAQLGHSGQFLLSPASSAFVDAMRLTTGIAAALALVGGIAVLRWMPGPKRPTIEELVAAEIEAAERDLEAGLADRAELSDR